MKNAVNKISVFNLIRGIGILLVIWDHGRWLFQNQLTGISNFIIQFIYSFTQYSLMSIFFMLSGYLSRKQSVGKYLKHQVNLIIKPYCITACITVLLVFIRNLASYHLTLQTIKETVKTALGFLLGISPDGLRYFGLQYSNCGPMWFLLALLIGTTVHLWVLNNFDEEKHLWIAAGVLILLIPMNIFGVSAWIPFSLFYGLYAYISVYFGYWMKKKKLLDKPIPKCCWLLGALCLLGTFAVEMGYVVNGGLQFFFDGIGAWYNAFLAIYLFCYFGDNENWLTDKLEYIGKNSLIFFCVHTVEYMSFPWWMVSNRFLNHPLLGRLVIYALRVFFCVVVSFLLLNRKTLWKKIHKE